jgi:PAS domain S-box-containing protein
MNLLIVDDHLINLKLLRTQLEAESHVVFEAHDGVDALALLERQRVDVVISDILMPRMDGYQLCHEIRKHTRHCDLPIIIYTSTYLSPGDEKLALDMGADKYLKKPVSVETLAAALHEVVAQPHAAPRPDALQEVVMLKNYNERLVSKLKEKNTELQAQTEALRASDEHFRTLVETAPDAIFIQTNRRFAYVNAAAMRLFGATRPEELLGQPVLDRFHPDFRALVGERIRLLNEDRQPVTSVDEVCLTLAGSPKDVNISAIPFTYQNQNGALVFVRDITARKRAEEEMNLQFSALSAAANAIVITDRAGKIEWVNPSFTKLTGYSADEAIGRTPRFLKSGQHPPEFYAGLWQTILAGNVWHGELVNKRKDGQLYNVEMTITPVRGADGQIAHFVAIKQDVTERRLLEDQLRQTQKMEAIGQLASGVAHDFNNILAIIQLQAGLLKAEQSLSPKQLDYAGEIEKATARAANLTRQLLLFSRKQALQPRDLDLNEVVTSITKMLQRTLGEDVEMQFKFSPQPLLIHADAGMMDQILMNLTINARDAMPKGGQLLIKTSAVEFDEITAAKTPQARPGSFACVSVSDNGGGIPPEILPRIFVPFFTTKAVGKGTGLGLATVFGIVQQHQGWINVYSEAGQGTTFRIYLPRLIKPSDKKAGWSSLASLRSGNETILLVEDDSSLRASIRIALSRLGYRVLEASNGVAALEVWKQHRDEIRLVLTDMVMPGGLTGKELGEQLLQQDPKLKVIYASGYSADSADKDFSMEEGVNFLTKPFAVNKLAQTVRNCLDKI